LAFDIVAVFGQAQRSSDDWELLPESFVHWHVSVPPDTAQSVHVPV